MILAVIIALTITSIIVSILIGYLLSTLKKVDKDSQIQTTTQSPTTIQTLITTQSPNTTETLTTTQSPTTTYMLTTTQSPITTDTLTTTQSPSIQIICDSSKPQKRVAYLGYNLVDNNIQQIVNDLVEMKVTHVLLAFVYQSSYKEALKSDIIDNFKALSSTSKSLLTTNPNFKIGTSIGGGANLGTIYPNIVNFQNIYSKSDAYYNKGTNLASADSYATDYYNLVSRTGLETYFDLDFEWISNDNIDDCVTFIGEVCKKLKVLSPGCTISHAPQPPYFTEAYGNVYNEIYAQYKDSFDWFNIQYYNNGQSQTFKEIFITSDTTAGLKTSVLELMNNDYKICPSYIVVGKTIEGESDLLNGYVELDTAMIDILTLAYTDSRLLAWKTSGGIMAWVYRTDKILRQLNSDGTYTVVSGDTAFSIGQSFDLSIDQLNILNNINFDTNPIIIDQNLNIVYYTVVSGDNLNSIAGKFGLTLAQIEAYNPKITDPTNISIGQQIIIRLSVNPNKEIITYFKNFTTIA